MNALSEKDRKPVNTKEWYDFIGMMSNILPSLHPGGLDATENLLEMLKLDPNCRVLDVGCGSGNTACMIVDRYGCRVTGIDISDVMITHAKERALRKGLVDKTDFRVADVYDLPFNDDEFDVVLVESVLTPLLGDKVTALRELRRVVKVGGVVGANEGTIDADSPQEMLELLAEHPAVHGTFTPESLTRLFEDSELQVIETRRLQQEKSPRRVEGMGFLGWLKFMTMVYPKLMLRLIRDKGVRQASKIDNELVKLTRDHMGVMLVVGKK
jgi:ubiquinone/menaquinone biosynthesis C-methylase UbiE